MGEDLLAGHVQELRRGTVVMATLAALRQPSYGYALLESLAGTGFEVDGNTLYPLLRRLEKQGLLTSRWSTDEARPRKYYATSPTGERILRSLLEEWHSLHSSIDTLS